MMGTVIDKSVLKRTAAKIGSLFAAGLPIISALRTMDSTMCVADTCGVDSCELSDIASSTIRSLLSERNASCVYNMTIEDILSGQ